MGRYIFLNLFIVQNILLRRAAKEKLKILQPPNNHNFRYPSKFSRRIVQNQSEFLTILIIPSNCNQIQKQTFFVTIQDLIIKR